MGLLFRTHGQITLELYTANRIPIKIQSGRRVCQLVFAPLNQKDSSYTGKYNGQVKSIGSSFFDDEDRKETIFGKV